MLDGKLEGRGTLSGTDDGLKCRISVPSIATHTVVVLFDRWQIATGHVVDVHVLDQVLVVLDLLLSISVEL